MARHKVEISGVNTANIKVLSSIWADTKPEMINMTKKLELKVYTAIEEEKLDKFLHEHKDFDKCECEDCGKCKKCYKENINLIVSIR